jgi:hypothetical protein
MELLGYIFKIRRRNKVVINDTGEFGDPIGNIAARVNE